MQVGSVNVIPQSANHMIVSLNGTIQKPNSSFTVSGSTITFASNLATGDVIDFIQILGDVLDLGVPSDATVTNAKISYPLAQSGAVVSQFNRTSDNGTIANFQKDGTVVGSLGTDSTGDFVIDGSSGHSGIRFKDTVLVPKQNGSDVDNTIDLGKSDKRWKDLYLGGGLLVGGTGSANKLDDYEEGTWTPSCSVASSDVSGTYVKVGNIVTAKFKISIGASGSNVNITGFPFTSNSDGEQQGLAREVETTGKLYFIRMGASGTSGTIIRYDANASVSTADSFQGQITYIST